jgi:DNA repair photolyase
MKLEKEQITLDDGRRADAQVPVIISASRATDIPAFYSDWLVNRIERGYVEWMNPFNGVPLYVSFRKTRLFVFWTKNPKPMFQNLDFFDNRKLNYYFQFTLNDYDDEGYEPGVPKVKDRIETFIRLSERLGKDRVIWRFDPLILTKKVSVKSLLAKVQHIGETLASYTEQFVFSFADIESYWKVAKNLAKAGIHAREFTLGEMHEFASGIQELNKNWNLKLGTCAEKVDLDTYGIEHNQCVDDWLLIRSFSHDPKLMAFLGYEIDIFGNLVPVGKKRRLGDAGQRKACGCMISKDIGAYNTCPHLCVYCYANA